HISFIIWGLLLNNTAKIEKMKSSGRKALQPRNIFNVPAADTQLQLKRAKAPPPLHDDAKDNLVPVPLPVVESMDASLAEELNAFKKKLERLREDRERTEKLLEERDGALDLKMSQLLQRGEIQKSLEIQVDRLFRLKELHSYSSKILPVRSLRAKEQEKRKSFSFNFQERADEPEADSREIASDLSKEVNY
ncbi:unnamed protein product, partial [Brassica rapa subsp. narinosa]